MKKLVHYSIPTKLFIPFKKKCQDEGRTMNGTIIMLMRIWTKGRGV